jgi:hypothetical protein
MGDMAKRLLAAVCIVAVALQSAAAEPPPKLAARDKNALRGWAHVEMGAGTGYKITNGIDTILVRRIPPQPRQHFALVRGPDGRNYSIGALSCGTEAYMVIGDFGGKQDPNSLAPLTTLECPNGSSSAFDFPDESDFQALVAVREPNRFRQWMGDKTRRGPFGMYMHGDEVMIVQAALPPDDRTARGQLAYVAVAVGDKPQLRLEAKGGVTLYLGRQGSDAVAARFLSCDRGALLVISRVEQGREEQAEMNALQLHCREGKEPSLPSLVRAVLRQ